MTSDERRDNMGQDMRSDAQEQAGHIDLVRASPPANAERSRPEGIVISRSRSSQLQADAGNAYSILINDGRVRNCGPWNGLRCAA